VHSQDENGLVWRQRGCAAFGDQHPGRSRPLLQELPELAFGSLLAAPALEEDIENEGVRVDRAPEPVRLAGDGDDHLVEVPFVVAPAWGSPTGCGWRSPDRIPGPHCRVVSWAAELPASPQPCPGSTGIGNTASRIADERGGVSIARIKPIAGVIRDRYLGIPAPPNREGPST
jgi:hypothetical protein